MGNFDVEKQARHLSFCVKTCCQIGSAVTFTIQDFQRVPGIAHDVCVGVGTFGEGEGSAIGGGGHLAVGEASSHEEGPRPAHGQLDDVRHDPVERHLKH